MTLITCSDCGKRISNKASACPGCGCPVSGPKTTGTRAGGVGKCPNCGSRNTVDVVEAERRTGGLAGAYGARLGLAFRGQGRFGCRDCGHRWVHGYSA